MIFSDEILNSYPTAGRITMSEERWAALRARLAAAETIVGLILNEHHTCNEFPCIFIEKIDAWRKAAGK